MAELERLRRRPEFLRVAAARRKWVTPGLILQASPRDAASDRRPGAAAVPADRVRYGITVSRKVGNAVQRNRARRRLRAVIRELLPEVGEPGVDYVVIGRKGTLSRDYVALRDDLAAAVRKLARRHASGSGGGDTRGPARPSGPRPGNRTRPSG